MLDPAVGEVDRVGARYGASSIVSLRLGEVSAGVVVSHGVLVVVGGRLSQVTRIITSHSVSNRVGNHRMGHGVGNRVSDDRVSHGVGHRVSDHRVSHSVGHRVSHDSVTDELGTGGGHHQKGGEADKGLGKRITVSECQIISNIGNLIYVGQKY